MNAGADVRPLPLEPGEFFAAFDAVARGADFRAALEALLLDLPDDRADELMQVLREARGSWFPLLAAGGGTLLHVGNSLSGTLTPLAASGFEVTALDPCEERARFARLRNEAHSPGRARVLVAATEGVLPFADQSFDVVVKEDGLGPAFDECLRVSRGEVVLVADNRLAYKRSSGRRGDFAIPSPAAWTRAALFPRAGERTLRGYRRAIARAGFASPRAFALYPHARDFSHVVALDEDLLTLTVGPKERRNRLKLAARSVGLFPVLTPSFVLIGARAARAERRPRIERWLAVIAERTGEPRPVIEHLVGTRGNTAVVHTRVPGQDERDPRGRWTLHVPLCPKNVPQLELHYRSLELVRARFPGVPVPEPLLLDRIDGAWLTCERRLPGFTAPQVSGDPARVGRMLADAARHFALLVVRSPAPFAEDDYEALIGSRFDLVSAHAAVPATIAALARMRDECRARFVGRRLARVLYHADLRGKHVQVERDGRVIGYLDWGTTEEAGLPYFDLLHLVIHERKQEVGCSAGEAWRFVRDRHALRPHETAALESYRRALDLDEDVARAIEAIYPVLVAAMAEKNWDYSRPRWLHRQFGL